MRKWWVAFLIPIIPAVYLLAAPPAPNAPIATALITPELRASLTRDYEIDVVVQPHDGDAWTRLAKRVTGDAAKWEEIALYNQADDVLRAEQKVRVPFAMLRPELQRQITATLFPSDKTTKEGWRHVVVGARGIEGESLWNIAEWFTGDGANYTEIRKANPTQGLSTRKGDVIVIPGKLLVAAFRGGTEGENAPTAAAEVRDPENDPVERAAESDDAPEAVASQSVGLPSLTYDRRAAEPHAVYRLQKGEALYSSVAIRFTGRVYSNDVGDVIDRIVKFNGIEDVAKIPVGYPVKIPMDLLLPEYLPHDDPTRVAAETAKRQSAKMARRTRARNLDGVHVILDAGHGGRDSGTLHEDVWESAYVYDVACRLKKLLEKNSAAKVSMTTRSKRGGFGVDDSDVVETRTDHYVQTTPRYPLEDAIVGVNLRWYLANSIFRRAIKSSVPKEKVVFLSIHADSLHPSLRGAMAYIPGERFVRGTYEKRGEIYLAHAEVRERPVVRFSENEALEVEGLSRELAESIIDAFGDAGLKVHPFNPVRDNVVRGGREWVPAVIRYNVVPTRLLLEVCNLGNRKDRALIKTAAYRQQVAETIVRGMVDFYARGEDARGATVADRGAR